MAQEEEPPSPTDTVEEVAASFLESLYGDPLRIETARTGRFLVVASAILIAVVLFNVRLQGTSLVPIDFGDRVEVLPMLLSLCVLLLSLSFLLRAVADVLRDREAQILVTRYVENERVKAAKKAALETDEDVFRGQDDEWAPQSEPWWDAYLAIRDAADQAVTRAQGKVGMRRLPRELRRARKILEIGVPISFAIIALFLSRAFLCSFGAALVAKLTA